VAKISPATISAYAEIMRRVPMRILVLKYGDRFGVATLRDRYPPKASPARRCAAASVAVRHENESLDRAPTDDGEVSIWHSIVFLYQGTD